MEFKTHSLHHEFSDDPIRIMAVVEKRDFDVTVVDWHCVHRPVVIAVIDSN